MKKLLIVLVLLMALPACASHIVGGEFELVRIGQFTYRLNLIYYFDEKDGDQGNKTADAIIHVKIFQVSDGETMAFIDIPFVSQTPVYYTQPACADNVIITSRQFYSTVITLSPDRYNDPDGYYVVWERCCRNYLITNIIDQKPPADSNDPDPPDVAGQTFYLKFPPVVVNGEEFINSSPKLFPPLSDYGCPGRPYYANFTGVDDDGDSLVYSMVTPFDTHDHTSYPDIQPAPYPWVRWKDGYDSLHMIGGSPDLRISRDGFLTCTPMKQGLFVFAVRVEEYRNKIKIGETRRDFQFFVAGGCQPDQPPQITGKKLTDSNFTYKEVMSVDFPDTVANGNRCIVVQVSDPDSQEAIQNFMENIHIKAIPLNFKSTTVNSVLPPVTSAKLVNGSTKEFPICFQLCPYIQSPYQLGIVAYDDACTLPMSDTLRVTVTDDRPPNSNPHVLPKLTLGQVNEGDQRSWSVAATDADGDNLTLSVVTDGFALNEAGMTFNVLDQKPGKASGVINWSAFCKIYDLQKMADFTVKILVDDQDPCNVVQYDTAILQLKVILPQINPQLKIVDESKTQDLTSTTIPVNLGHLAFNVVGTDDNPLLSDTLRLSLLESTGDPVPRGFVFNNATNLHSVESKFTWDLSCAIFQNGINNNEYTFKFLVENDHCKEPKTDTAFVKVNVKDIESSDKDFLPANVITTYPDHCNDFFAIEEFGPAECGPRTVSIAPADNCSNRFERVKIYDRWGKLVFESNDRKFRWYASSETAGVYYYIIEFTQKQYKSSLTVIH